jgi:hypothetical protein
MASVKRNLYATGVILLLAVYAAYLVWDNHLYKSGERRREIVSQHLKQLRDQKTFDGLIIGGSNSYYSLSSGLIQTMLGERWYNASIMSGGFSNRNMHDFIGQVAAAVDVHSVKTIVFSSIVAYQKGDVYKRDRALAEIDGKLPLSLKPQRSALSHLKDWVIKPAHVDGFQLPLPDSNGDIQFLKTTCPDVFAPAQFSKEDPQVVAKYIVDNLQVIGAKFPASKIYVVFPSLFADERLSLIRDRTYIEKVVNLTTALSKELHSDKIISYGIVFQPKFPAVDMVCDYPHHANSKGREWRTRNLLKNITSGKSELTKSSNDSARK